MRTDFYFKSHGEGMIHGCRWTPEGEVKAVVQILHGIAEFVERYEEFAQHLNSLGILVVAEDHMGHGKSMETGTQGYFAGGWEAAVDDSYRLLKNTRAEFPDVPYVLFGHSMGSFMARTILIRYPNSGIRAAVICGTGWMPEPVLAAGQTAAKLVCKAIGDRNPSEQMQKLIFGSYNARIEHPKTSFDWLSRDMKKVCEYVGDAKCGFTASCGLLRDMVGGMAFSQKKKNLEKMDRSLPVLFVAGGDDPVGNYGEGVRQAGRAFEKVGMQDVTVRLFPLARHEILNEINREEIYKFVSDWIRKKAKI